jgi:uncharacterized protein YodC (DUF2158 family)
MKPATEVKVGDVVRYAKGSVITRMTVSRIHDDFREDGAVNWIECTWYDGERYCRAQFSPDELEVEEAEAVHS